MSPDHDRLPADLEDLAGRLRDERPALDGAALDGLSRRVHRSVAAPARRRRSSLAVALCLCFGLVFSSAGTGLAISGLASSDQSASQAQYGGVVTDQGGTTTTPTLGTYTSGGGGSSPSPTVKGTSTTAPAPQQAAQSTQQLSATQGNATLPFTGFAALPVIALGIALLAAGLVVRRRGRPTAE